MRVLMVHIPLRPDSSIQYFPIGLSYVASRAKSEGYDVDVLDLNCPQGKTSKYDVIGMGGVVTGYKYIKSIASEMRAKYPDALIVAGNSVASSIPEILLTNTDVDVAVLGEGEETFVDLLGNDLPDVKGIAFKSNGKIVRTQERSLMNIDHIPYPLWDMFDVEYYIKSMEEGVKEPRPPVNIRAFSINTARGCPYSCSFCYHVFRGKRYRMRSPASVVGEMRELQKRYGINCFILQDELTLLTPGHAEIFANAIMESGLDIYFGVVCRAGLFRKDEHIELVRRLKEAGCMSVAFSLESASPEILKWMNKRMTIRDFVRQVEIVRKGGLAPLTSVVFGYPCETKETIERTLGLCEECNIYPSTGYLLPLPGTPMYNYAIANGFIVDEEEYLISLGDRQDLRLNMTSMEDSEFTSYVEDGLARLNDCLGMGLTDGQLVKTGHYRVAKVYKGASE